MISRRGLVAGAAALAAFPAEAHIYPGGRRVLSPAFSPGMVGGSAFWFDASQALTVTQNGNDVASINDISGKGRTAFQGTAANQPAYSVGGLSGLNSILFSGANSDALSVANSLGIANGVPGVTFVGVVRPTSLAAANRIVTVFNNGGLARFSLSINITSGRLNCAGRRLDADTGVSVTSTSATATAAGRVSFVAASLDYTTGVVLLACDARREAMKLTFDGGYGHSAQTNSNLSPLLGTQATNLYSGDIGEAAVWPRALNYEEIGRLRNYFKPKWATF